MKADVLARVAKGADELVVNFLRLSPRRAARPRSPRSPTSSTRSSRRRSAILDVELTTATELTDDEFASDLGQIESASGRKVQAERKVDPDLIGGIVLQAGSMRLDASVRGRLERLRPTLPTQGASDNMKLRPEEITSILRERIEKFDVESEPRRGRRRAAGRRRHRPHPRPRELPRARDARARARRRRPRVQPRGGQRRRRALRRVGQGQGGRAGAAHRQGRVGARSARRCSAASSTRSATRSTASARSSRPRRAPSSGRRRA